MAIIIIIIIIVIVIISFITVGCGEAAWMVAVAPAFVSRRWEEENTGHDIP